MTEMNDTNLNDVEEYSDQAYRHALKSFSKEENNRITRAVTQSSSFLDALDATTTTKQE